MPATTTKLMFYIHSTIEYSAYTEKIIGLYYGYVY